MANHSEDDQVTETRFRTPEPPESQPPPSTPRSHSQPLPFRSYPYSNFTPASKVKAAVSPEFRAASKVETRRKLILESDVPKMIPEIPWQDYFDRILPPLPKQLEGKVEDVLQRLEANGTILHDRWKAFPVDPALGNESEQTVFHRLTQVYDAVVDAATQIDNALRPTFGLVVNGNVAMQSDRGTSSRPDAFLKLYPDLASQSSRVLRNSTNLQRSRQLEIGPHYVYDIANPQQFKLNDDTDDTDDDVAKLVYDMQQVLALDPCRRFTLGATIENRTMRLWFLSRATLLKTKPFNFIKDRHQLVHYFLSLAFSSTTDMGWDPTMEFSHYDRNKRRQYKIKVNGQIFTTVDVLSDVSADSPLGRATRSLIASKNTRSTRQSLRGRKSTIKPTKVPVVDRKIDDTTVVMLHGYDLSNVSLVDLISSKTPSKPAAQSVGFSMPRDRDSTHPTTGPNPDYSQASQEGSDAMMSANVAEKHSHHHRYHYRIVFEQCATTLYNEPRLRNTMRALIAVVRALRVLHRIGWIHRDISGGNIYWFADEKTGLLGDFEYATPLKEPRQHNVRTGTPFFMAAETLANGYLFTAVQEDLSADEVDEDEDDDDDDDDDDSDDDDDYISFEPQIDTETPVVSGKTSHPSFSHNPLHDLESIWWILVYVLFFNDDACKPSENSKTRQERMDELFHGTLEIARRLLFLTQSAHLDEAKGYLSPSFAPAIEVLKELALLLTAAYYTSEQQYNTTQKIDDEGFKIHSRFWKSLTSNSLNTLRAIMLVPVKDNGKKRTNLGSPETELPAKRSRTSVPPSLKLKGSKPNRGRNSARGRNSGGRR
ncbi:hypothetical protein EV361DRAFT_258153 [Lentinula raphanica]|nr:hypothetical protein EV361DRAFT_258153 [Lentinula raphanica]